MSYPRTDCACGRTLASNVFRQHARKCVKQLQMWADEGHAVYPLDERSEEEKAKTPIHLPYKES